MKKLYFYKITVVFSPILAILSIPALLLLQIISLVLTFGTIHYYFLGLASVLPFLCAGFVAPLAIIYMNYLEYKNRSSDKNKMNPIRLISSFLYIIVIFLFIILTMSAILDPKQAAEELTYAILFLLWIVLYPLGGIFTLIPILPKKSEV